MRTKADTVAAKLEPLRSCAELQDTELFEFGDGGDQLTEQTG